MWTISRVTADSLRHAGGTIVELCDLIKISWDMNYKDVYSPLNHSKSAPKARK